MQENRELLKGLTVISLEQALSMPYCTYRLALKGASVTRIEALQGDPNRYVGFPLGDEQAMNSQFLCVNAGKQSVSLNLADERGQKLLREIVEKMSVDIFCTNQLPKNYSKLGISYEILSSIKPDIIWVGLSGFGPEKSEPAYDPIIQAMAGIMDVTGEPDRDPLMTGVPIADLEAGNQAYSAIMEALYKRAITGKGSRIDISMFQCAAALLSTKITNFEFGEPAGRNGNRHRLFAPVNTYPTEDGYVIIAAGNDRQWALFVANHEFAELNKQEYSTNKGRIEDIERLEMILRSITSSMKTEQVIKICKDSGIPVAKVATLNEIMADPDMRKSMSRAKDPVSGYEITLPIDPVAQPSGKGMVHFPPRLGEHNEEVMMKFLGYSAEEIKELRETNVIS
ncbi:CaiB/BaiF CoA transferase family protein [Paradesulfitobacterium ferrireducens]|uniref:CaiB/BaiF CoA transferase family protein n=1 Tax=Paradesulfitobacterium ferrireducens TaxID=2816476 RepID=UPI001A8DEBE5|nr:CoA transferase [Paradesulfitobacterium ferrireducens]